MSALPISELLGEGQAETNTSVRLSVKESVREVLAAGGHGAQPTETPEFRRMISELIRSEHPEFGDDLTATLAVELADEFSGLGPIQRYLDDASINEVMVNGPDEVWVESRGVLRRTQSRFESTDALRHVIERTVGPLGLRVDDSYPIADARLPDGSRFHAVLPPIARNGPVVTIRKFSDRPYRLTDLERSEAICAEASSFLRKAIRARANIVVAGGTSSGKTSLLNALSAEISAGERLVTVEDAAELRLVQPHVVALEARPPNVDGSGEISIRDLVRAALRMRPDRIIVGEVRGPEALDMIQAMNTGHEGSVTTVHANSTRDFMLRLEAMVLMADLGLESSVVRSHIEASIDLVVQLTKLADGRRVVWEIAEVAPDCEWPDLNVLFSRNEDMYADCRPASTVRLPEMRAVSPATTVIERCISRGHEWLDRDESDV